jgi:DNA-binding transcriptional ArsR family regulator
MPIDNIICQSYLAGMHDLQVIEDPAAAAVAMEPTRSRILAELAQPASAATLATRVGLARQKVNYHLRALEAHGLVELAEERKWGGLTERLLIATAASYVVSPNALGPIAADPGRDSLAGLRRGLRPTAAAGDLAAAHALRLLVRHVELEHALARVVERDPHRGAFSVRDLRTGDVGDEHSLTSHRSSSLESGKSLVENVAQIGLVITPLCAYV